MKLHIAMIEDEEVFSDQLASLLQQWTKETGNYIHTHLYSSGNPFLLDFDNGIPFDAVFIDVILPHGANGIEIAKMIRRVNESIPIIFVTGDTENIGQGYRVSAMQYLVKPARYSDIKLCMDKVHDLISRYEKTMYCFHKGKKSMMRIAFQDILYFSSALQYTEIHTCHGVERQLERLKNIETLLPKEFIRCHRSFIVNIEAIHAFDSKTIVLAGNIVLPLSKTYLEEVTGRCIEYFSKDIL